MATNEINSLEFKSRSEKIVGKNRISESFDQGSKSFLRSGEMSSKGLTVKMLKKEMNVRTGDMVILLGAIISDDLDLNVSWYIDKKEVISGGRFRHWRKGFDCCMEIFDCNITDAGDIMCIVRAENYIASDNTILHVNDDDMAGIEPQFLQLLEFEEINDCLRLACQVSGYPTPYVTFHFRNRRIVSNQRITIDRNNDFWMVRINRCTVDDEGKYIAIARNRIGRTLSSCSVILRNKNPSTYIADV
uniref:Immunoglobulin I-set domain-containing protein n=1 Tax=Setaria digitata TaxID=48799 RepID=A0A915PU67_9BILA